MPLENLHLTVMEMAHSKTWPEIASLIEIMNDKIPEITSFTQNAKARLVKPMISYDSAAIALSFLPAAGDDLYDDDKKVEDDRYTYHHLRRDMFDLCRNTGAEVASRYVVPSAHLTIARFVNQDIYEGGKVGDLVEEIERLNETLSCRSWPNAEEAGCEGKRLQWVVGEEKGLVCRKGTVWYGGGESHWEGHGI